MIEDCLGTIDGKKHKQRSTICTEVRLETKRCKQRWWKDLDKTQRKMIMLSCCFGPINRVKRPFADWRIDLTGWEAKYNSRTFSLPICVNDFTVKVVKECDTDREGDRERKKERERERKWLIVLISIICNQLLYVGFQQRNFRQFFARIMLSTDPIKISSLWFYKLGQGFNYFHQIYHDNWRYLVAEGLHWYYTEL